MALAGYAGLVSCATGAAETFSDMDGIKDFTVGDSRDELDITDFKDGGNVRARMMGLRDFSVELSGDLEPADAGYLKMRAAYEAGDTMALKVWYNHNSAATAGIGLLLKVASLEISGAVDGKLELSASLMADSSSGTALFAL